MLALLASVCYSTPAVHVSAFGSCICSARLLCTKHIISLPYHTFIRNIHHSMHVHTHVSSVLSEHTVYVGSVGITTHAINTPSSAYHMTLYHWCISTHASLVHTHALALGWDRGNCILKQNLLTIRQLHLVPIILNALCGTLLSSPSVWLDQVQYLMCTMSHWFSCYSWSRCWLAIYSFEYM